jgi:hypothetical protein
MFCCVLYSEDVDRGICVWSTPYSTRNNSPSSAFEIGASSASACTRLLVSTKEYGVVIQTRTSHFVQPELTRFLLSFGQSCPAFVAQISFTTIITVSLRPGFACIELTRIYT